MKTILFFCLALFALSPKAQTIYTVTKTTDPDPFVYPYDYEDSLCAPEMYGTLQWAIRKANDTQDSVKIVFNINQSEPDIILNFTLPVITNKVFIDGTTQQGYISGHPKIKIVGGGGIKVQANGCKFKGLYIEQNNYIGIQCYYADYTEITECVINKINTANAITYIGEGAVSIYNSNHCKITENYIGTNADSCTCYYPDMLTSSCRNGINIVSYPLSLKTRPSNYNVIKNNTIANCSEKAIWIQQNCKYNSISENKIYQCANAIVLSGNGNENKQPPVITSFENDTLYGTSVPNDIIEVFGSTGDENANEYLGTTQADGSGNWNLFAQTTYQYVVTTATDENSNTSNFSLKFEVKTCLGSICFEAPGHPYCSDGNPVPSWCNEKTICLGDTVKIYFCEMCGGVDDWHVIINTNTNSWGTYNFTQVANYGPYQVWETSFIPNAQGYYDLTLYVYNVTQNTLNPYHLSLTVLSLPTPNITQYPNLCQGSTAVLNAGSGFSSYLWNTVPPETTQAITISQPGTYSVTVTDSHGCSGTDDIVVTQYDSPIVSITGNTTICNNGSTTLTAQPSANSYLWSNNSTTQSITVNQAGPYSVTVTGQGNCTAIASVVVTQNPAISIQTSQTNITCNGGTNGSATVVVSGGTPGYSYSWSNGATTATTSGLSAGTYSVTVTDANLCTATTQVTITQPSQINYTASITNVSCFSGNNGAVSLAASGGVPFHTPPPFNFPYYHYQWNNGTTSNILNNLIAGTYTCTITDANSCTTVATVYISQPPKIQATFNLTPPSCFGYNNGSVSVNVNGGTPPYTYQWNNGANVNYINHQTAGNYNVTITDANQCTTVFNTTLTQPTELTADIIDYTQQPLCGNSNDGMVMVTTNHGGTPPYLYNIGNGNQTNNQFNNLQAGTYQVTVTDAHGCTATTFPVTIQGTPLSMADFNISGNCFYKDGQVEFINNSQYATSYLWNFGDGTTSTQINPAHTFTDYGYYCITLTAYNECGAVSYTKSIFVEPSQCACNYNYTKPNGAIILSGTTEYWNDESIRGDVIIENNATLTVNGTLRFSPESRIIVLRGGHLILNYGARLTSLDPDICPVMWQGVEVWGSPYATSSNIIQGRITLMGLSTIENAHIAILLGARGQVCRRIMPPINWESFFNNNYAGGIIKTPTFDRNVYFLNNGIDIKYLPKSTVTNDGLSNKINRCLFINSTNAPLLDPHYNSADINHYPNIHNPWAGKADPDRRSTIGIQITNIKGLSITNCSFMNHEYGIISTDAQQTAINGCSFLSLRQGINIQNSTPTLQSGFDITGCSFNYIPGTTSGTLTADDGTAIYINSGRGYKIHDGNQFLNDYIPFNNPVYGIKTSNASGIEITNNKFIRLTTGIIISNSGHYGSSIKAAPNSFNTNLNYQGNIFEKCITGIVTKNNNVNLCIRCNTYNTPTINNYNWINETGSILADQGFPGFQNITNNYLRSRYGAGNYFLPSSSKLIKNDVSNPYYNYYHHTTPEYIPVAVGNIHLFSIGVPFYSNSISCPFPISIPSVNSITPTTPLTDPVFTRIDSLNNAVATLQQQYNTLLTNADKGQTQALLDAIMATPPLGELKNMLIANSPLSDTVLIALNTQFPLSAGNYKNVMDENLPVSRKTAPSFYSRVQTLPNGIKNQLLSKQANNPGKTTLGSVELQLDQTKQIKSLYFSSVISALLDSAVNRKADAITLLEQEGTPEANLILASTYMSDSNYTAAASKIAQLPDDNGTYSDWKAYATMLLTHFEQGKTLEELDSNQIAYIRTLAYQCPDEMATANAKAVLFYLFREKVPPCSEIQSRQQNVLSKTEKAISYLGDNYPDPFNNQTVIPYCLPDQVRGELIVKDASGKIILIAPLNNAEEKIEINTKNWATGIYFYGLRVDGREEENRKMIKTE
jgi:PKD repeat protein